MAEETLTHSEIDAFEDRADERIYAASQWQLMWWRLRKHRLAMVSGLILIGFYAIVAGAEFMATSNPRESNAKRGLMKLQPIRWFDGWQFRPHVYAVKGKRDPRTFKRVYQADPTQKLPVRFFVPGFEYKFLGFFPANLHLLGVEGARAEDTLFLLGTDLQGRDIWSRLMYATRISMTIGLVSVALSLFLGLLLGGISGFYGGWIDTVIQRVIEILRSIPTIPLWMGLAAAVPKDWSVTKMYFAITIIISLIGWTELARVVRGRFLSLGRGFRHGGGVGRCQPHAGDLPPHGAVVYESHHRSHHPGPARHYYRGDVSQLSRSGHATAGH